MASEELVHTIFGKYSKYEIFRTGTWTTKFEVRKDSKYWGTYSSLNEAVESAQKAG